MQKQLERHRPAPVYDPDSDGDPVGSRTQRLRTQSREAAEKAKDVTKKALGREERVLQAMRRQRGGQ
jgi:hypothetical protein